MVLIIAILNDGNLLSSNDLDSTAIQYKKKMVPSIIIVLCIHLPFVVYLLFIVYSSCLCCLSIVFPLA